jgi:hypothetical protein
MRAEPLATRESSRKNERLLAYHTVEPRYYRVPTKTCLEPEQEEHRSSGVQEFRRILNLGLEVSYSLPALRLPIASSLKSP